MNKFFLVLSAVTLIPVCLVSAYGTSIFDDSNSQITSSGDIYFKSKVPVAIPFDVKANDSSGILPVQCDKTSGSLFKMGKTTVRCMAITSTGIVLRNSFVVTVGYDIVQIPNWFKQTTKLWASQSISDKEYVDSLQFLLENNLVKVPYSKPPKSFSNLDIPVWIKANSQKWVRDTISDDEFSIGIQWMLERGILENQKGRV